jgi:hypothetical protein
MSYNRWNYVVSNPINFTDPSGFCPTCFVYFFPGAGNKGDIDDPYGGIKDDHLNDNLGSNERIFVELLSQRGVTVIPVYPYGEGIRTNWDKDNPIFGQDTNGNFRYAILPSAYNLSTIPKTKADEINDSFKMCRQENKWNISFIGYSGGGQMAYSTAQKLTDRIFVDNLVLIGAPFRAHNDMGNIGHIWDLVAANDTDKFGKGGEEKLGWDRFNSGYRRFSLVQFIPSYYDEWDIYRSGATKCTFYGPNYIHYGPGDYFEANTAVTRDREILNLPFEGGRCISRGAGFGFAGNDRSRLQNLVDFLINVVGIGRPE